LAEQIVLSQQKGVREASSSVVVTFLLTYPLGEKRALSQLQQLINNCGYEYEDGRLAAIDALHSVVKVSRLCIIFDSDLFVSNCHSNFTNVRIFLSHLILPARSSLSHSYSQLHMSSNNIPQALPPPVLEKNSELLFLPLTLRVVNDKAPKCRQAASNLLVTLSRRIDGEVSDRDN
jgi:hypothetical protein